MLSQRHAIIRQEHNLQAATNGAVAVDRGGEILLCRLAHGAIGAENAHLLGTLLVSKLHQAALARQRVREEQRRYFWLYMDEFHHFATPSMASVLSGVRKYRLGLVLAHQELAQLDSVPEVASAAPWRVDAWSDAAAARVKTKSRKTKSTPT